MIIPVLILLTLATQLSSNETLVIFFLNTCLPVKFSISFCVDSGDLSLRLDSRALLNVSVKSCHFFLTTVYESMSFVGFLDFASSICSGFCSRSASLFLIFNFVISSQSVYI